MWCWRRLLRVPWASRSNQSVLKEINPEYALEGLMLSWSSNTLATWCKEPAHWKRPWCWERLKVGEGDDRGWDGWMASPSRWTWVWANSESWWWTGKPGVLQSRGSQRAGHDWATSLFLSLSGGIKLQLHYFLVYKLEKLFYLPQSKFAKRGIITYPISCS